MRAVPHEFNPDGKPDGSAGCQRMCWPAALRANELSIVHETRRHLTHAGHERSPVFAETSCGLGRAKRRAFTAPGGKVEQLRANDFSGDHADLRRRQASLQNFTLSQSRSHFFRHANGRPQARQIFSGRCSLRTPRMPHESLSMRIMTSLRRNGIGVHGGS